MQLSGRRFSGVPRSSRLHGGGFPTAGRLGRLAGRGGNSLHRQGSGQTAGLAVRAASLLGPGNRLGVCAGQEQVESRFWRRRPRACAIRRVHASLIFASSVSACSKLLLHQLQLRRIVQLLLCPGHLLPQGLNAPLKDVRLLFNLFIDGTRQVIRAAERMRSGHGAESARPHPAPQGKTLTLFPIGQATFRPSPGPLSCCGFAVRLHRADPLQGVPRTARDRRGCRGPADRCRPTAGADRGPPGLRQQPPATAPRLRGSTRRPPTSANSSSMPPRSRIGWSLDQAIARPFPACRLVLRRASRPVAAPCSTVASDGTTATAPVRIDEAAHRSAASASGKPASAGNRASSPSVSSSRAPRLVAGHDFRQNGLGQPGFHSKRTPAARPGSANIRRISMAIRSGLTTRISPAMARDAACASAVDAKRRAWPQTAPPGASAACLRQSGGGGRRSRGAARGPGPPARRRSRSPGWPRIVEQAVDGEMAPRGVLSGRAEGDAVGMAAVAVGGVAAKGGHLRPCRPPSGRSPQSRRTPRRWPACAAGRRAGGLRRAWRWWPRRSPSACAPAIDRGRSRRPNRPRTRPRAIGGPLPRQNGAGRPHGQRTAFARPFADDSGNL